MAILPMIESKAGWVNADEDLVLDGAMGVSIGPADMRLSLGSEIKSPSSTSFFVKPKAMNANV